MFDSPTEQRTLLNNDNYFMSVLSENDNLIEMVKKLNDDFSLKETDEFRDEFMYEFIKGQNNTLTIVNFKNFMGEQGI